ncbi:hypothetical protein TNCV_2023261 [Trichonephila clavipes]|nr:hypothetical protein TNCV_2023261 [Trichonephila clavipes]
MFRLISGHDCLRTNTFHHINVVSDSLQYKRGYGPLAPPQFPCTSSYFALGAIPQKHYRYHSAPSFDYINLFAARVGHIKLIGPTNDQTNRKTTAVYRARAETSVADQGIAKQTKRRKDLGSGGCNRYLEYGRFPITSVLCTGSASLLRLIKKGDERDEVLLKWVRLVREAVVDLV